MPVLDRIEHEIDPRLQEKILEHEGKWVAFTRSEILVVGDSAAQVLKAARKQGVTAPAVVEVPKTRERHFYFF